MSKGAFPSGTGLSSPTEPVSAVSALRASIPCALDMLTMSDAQIAVLDRMSDELGYPFRDIAADTGVPEKECRTIIRNFHRLGLAAYGPLYSEDEPRVMGSGYWLTRQGYDAQQTLWGLLRGWSGGYDLWDVLASAASAIEARQGQDSEAGLIGEADESAAVEDGTP